MIAKIAWRNIWRNTVRSLVVIISVIIGIWAITFIAGFYKAMSNSFVKTAIQNEVSHLQIHAKGYVNDPSLKKAIPDAKAVVDKVEQLPEVKALSSRLLVDAMAATASSSRGVSLRGIDTVAENKVTHLKSHLIKGKYLQGSAHPVLIGEELAKKLHVKHRNKIIFTFQNVNGEITSASFRVTGIFKTPNSSFDKQNVFVPFQNLSQLLGMKGKTTEIAILLKNNEEVPSVQAKLTSVFPNLDVKNWKEIAPTLELMVESSNQFLYLFILIIVMALLFGIVNTMLMSVLERTREIGMLKALGMNRKKLFRMITTETFYLSLAGTPIGLLLAYITISITGKYGINLGSFAQGLSSYGMSSVVYPDVEPSFYVLIAVFIFIATIIASIYPAIKALKKNPTEAMRTIG